uniref:Glutathione-dependent formaldehyde-activating n=1 Tax=Coccidioides posadasii RMSCC 3488 TaxID=454284 RepID=A0A0J6FLV9_COCPO|nr:glutathione-dependent formaldehyde-activating [Coccidioides posadasii RMSCC 3488]
MVQEQQSSLPTLRPYNGGCHCGAVRYRALLDPANLGAARCNCTICHKKGGLILQLSDETLSLVKPSSYDSAELGDYTFGSGSAHHYFCKTCGISVFSRGTTRRIQAGVFDDDDDDDDEEEEEEEEEEESVGVP